MKLRSLALRNFRQHADSLLHFPESGIIAIVGQNEGGKSTILEAIAFALYGTKAIRGSKDGLRWKRATARKQAEVALEFDVAGSTYIVQRSESDARVFGTGMAKIAAGTAAVNDYLPGLIGMGLEEFRHTFLAEQKQLATIAAMKGVQRRQFFLEVLGVGKVDEALEACRKRKNSLANEVDGASMGLGDRSALEAELAAAQAGLNAARTELSGAHAEHDAAVALAADASEALNASDLRRRRHEEAAREHASAVERHALAQAEVDRAVRQLDEARAAAVRVADRELELAILPELTLQRDALRTARSSQAAREQFQKSILRSETEIHEVLGAIAAAETLVASYKPEAHEKADTELAALRGELAKHADIRRAAAATARAAYEHSSGEAKKTDRKIQAIRAAGKQGACPTCMRELADAFAAVLEKLELEHRAMVELADRAMALDRDTQDPSPRETELSDNIADLESVRAEHLEARTLSIAAGRQLKDRHARREQAEDALTELRGHLATTPAAPFDAAELARVEFGVTRLQALDKALQADRSTAARVSDLENEIADRLPVVAAETERQLTCTQKIREINFRIPDHELVVRAAAVAQHRREEAGSEVARCQEAVNAAEARLERSSSILTAYDLRASLLDELRADLRTHEQAAVRLADFRAALASTIRPEMESLVSGFVSILTDGRHEAAAIDDDFNVTLFESGVAMEVVSGGAEDIVALSLRLAISQMIAERAGHPLTLLILDEPITSLDEVRRANTLDLIRRLRSTFEQVILISHVPEIREAADYTISVEFDEAAGCSRVTTPTAPSQPEPATVAA